MRKSLKDIRPIVVKNLVNSSDEKLELMEIDENLIKNEIHLKNTTLN